MPGVITTMTLLMPSPRPDRIAARNPWALHRSADWQVGIAMLAAEEAVAIWRASSGGGAPGTLRR